MTRYVVFSQDKAEPCRVDRIIGPFSTYDRAADYVRYMNQNCNPDDSIWYGIRELEKTVIQKM